MLYLNPPYHVIDGVSLLPDHADPLQYYFMPLEPHLSTMTDAATGQRIPKLSVLKFSGRSTTGELLSGGFLDFDCNLGIEPERLATIGEELASVAGLAGAAKLAPVPLIDGTVRMVLFGRESPTEEDRRPRPGGAPADTPQFVLKISHHAKPALYGDNQAAFSVRLDAEGVTILEQALQGELAPIGVVYSLRYVGLRPAYRVRVQADWDRVQRHLESSERVNVPFIYSSQVDEVVDELVESRAIVIEGDNLIADGDGGDGATGRYEAALEQVREMVLETFFEPSLDPMQRQTGDTIDDLQRLSRIGATGGLGSVYEYRKVDLTRIDRKSLNVDMSERTSVIREIHPQGHLTGITRAIRQQGLDLSRFIIPVRLDDDFFKRRQVRVIPRAEFQTDGITSVNVSLAYEGETKNVVFEAGTGEQVVEWPSRLDGDRMRAEVAMSYVVTFAAAGGQGRPPSLRAPEVPVVGDVVEVSPRGDGLYEVMWVAFNAVDLPWDLYPVVEVHCAYADPANGVDIRNHYGLNAEANSGAWPVFLVDRTRRTVQYNLVLHGADGRDWTSGWLETDDAQIRITDPYGERRTLDIVAPTGLFDTELDRAFVDVEYDDSANGVHKRQSFELHAGQTATQRFAVELVDRQRREVRYRVSMLFRDGRLVEVPMSSTTGDRIFLSPAMRGHRSVAVRADGIDFARSGVQEIRVELHFEDGEAQLRFADDVRLTADRRHGTFEYDYVAADRDDYRYRTTMRFANGLSRDSGWVETDVAELVVSL